MGVFRYIAAFLVVAGTAGSAVAQPVSISLTPHVGYASVGAYYGPMSARSDRGRTDALIELDRMPFIGAKIGFRTPGSRWGVIVDLLKANSEVHSYIYSYDGGGGSSIFLIRRDDSDARIRHTIVGLEGDLRAAPVTIEGRAGVLFSSVHAKLRERERTYHDRGLSGALAFGGPSGVLAPARVTLRGALIRTTEQMFTDLKSQSLGFGDGKKHWLRQVDLSLGWRVQF